MSKYIILCDNPKKLKKSITNTEKYIISDKVPDDSCDVIFVSKKTSVSEADLDMIATMLDSRKIIVGTSQKKSGFKKLIYKFFGASHGENCCGIVGIPREHISIITDNSDLRAISIIKSAETNKLPIVELPLSKSEYDGGFSHTVSDLFYLFLLSQPLKFIFSSCVAFMIDCTVFVLFDKYTLPAGLLMPNWFRIIVLQFTAWSVSSLTNFFINRYFVFKSRTPFWPSLAEYYGLAGIVFLLKTGLLEVIANLLPIVLIIAKITAEVTFFVINYFVQKLFIFKPNKQDNTVTETETEDSSDTTEKTEE